MDATNDIKPKEITSFKARTEELVSSLDQLRTEMIHYRKSAKTFNDATSELKDATDRHQVFTENLTGVVKKIDEYIGGLYNLSTEKTIEQISTLHTDVQTIKTNIVELDDILKQITSFNKSLPVLQNTAKYLTDSLAENYKQNTEIIEALKTSNIKIDAFEKRINKLETLLTDAYSMEQKVRDDNAELRDQMAKLIQRLTEEPKKKSIFKRK